MRSILLLFYFLCIKHLAIAQNVDPASVVGKVICGYQGWFNCYGDGSPVASWRHWTAGVYQSNIPNPAPGNVRFEVYPDVTEYGSGQLFPTSLGPLGDGNPAVLFSSYPEEVIDLHFSWMEQHGIDGVALQRFIAETFDGVFKAHRDSVAARVARQATAHGRMFYMMYDLSGLPASQYDAVKTDWSNTLDGPLNLTASPAYAYQDGKPVVALWGVGFTHVQGNAAQSLDLINWFKAQGCYVIGGLPTHWRTGTGDSKPDFEAVYQALDMISPWTVGRYGDIPGVDNFRTNLIEPDLAWCNANNIDYQPVAFPGFAWSNWNGGAPNLIPRDKGNFFWRQAYNIRDLGIPSMYIAMFDEYDEGTAIAPAADSYLKTPVDQYFLTYSADGEYCSPDFYLRLAGKSTQLIKNLVPLTVTHGLPASAGPVWLRTSLEAGFDAMPSWTNTLDESSIPSGVSGTGPGGMPACLLNNSLAHAGSASIRLKGNDNSSANSHAYFKIFEVNIPVNSDTWLRFWSFPENDLGRYVSIDLIMTDGSTLRDASASDINGNSMHPGAGRGQVGQWYENVCHIGNWLNGKTIDRIMIAYDYGPETGSFTAFVDDITLFNSATAVGAEHPVALSTPALRVSPNPGNGDLVTVDWRDQSGDALLKVYDGRGRIQYTQTLNAGNLQQVDTRNWPAGVYIFSAESRHGIRNTVWLNPD
ncbi:MAG: T9SS type A sorting domain-containing protein [Saprospiraceae bacterium]|nr:T9SS type A sorting domain-containing protein [Saprospiraceae bacterium]